MKYAYFVVRMNFDSNGNVINGSEDVVSLLTDTDAIRKAEKTYLVKRNKNKCTYNLALNTSTKPVKQSMRPTVPEMSAFKMKKSPFPKATN